MSLDPEDVPALRVLPTYLPPSMKAVELREETFGLAWREDHRVYASVISITRALDFVSRMPEALPQLYNITLTIRISRDGFDRASPEQPMQLEEEIIGYWMQVADALVQQGTSFRVRHYLDCEKSKMYPLVEPGFSVCEVCPDQTTGTLTECG